MTNFRPGDKVRLYPGDTHKKIAKILHCGEHGWEFEFIEGTENTRENNVGDIKFISHSQHLTMIKIGR